jgi:hypothetical protein|tara:strand:+ start:1097 stop:1330 length:234 start_codon:yes stop_codon:yes gene_type:complete
MKILYTGEDGIVSIMTPVFKEINPETGKIWTIEEIAKKDVPTGKKYKIVEDSDVSTDRSFRDAWVVDEADLTDGVGS